MPIDRRWNIANENDPEAARQTASLAGLAAALALVVAGLFLTHQLAANARIGDCRMSGRFDCDPPVAALNGSDSRTALVRAP